MKEEPTYIKESLEEEDLIKTFKSSYVFKIQL